MGLRVERSGKGKEEVVVVVVGEGATAQEERHGVIESSRADFPSRDETAGSEVRTPLHPLELWEGAGEVERLCCTHCQSYAR